ncbi:rho GDP-dissociation inhibitor 1-like [Homarus americanus]|uniref:Rho GDP-dissociation inhibitor 3 n=1 Tax=Homarus americanus TaxID=6706 RepID=A0A8J5J6E7_HOMAM|nr:rho GDP-dissociation inhibitor 1-like [Homarus americanus]XP_042208765.1 rho GDP-dissociation inhibitor 1-like [Homarus americanus]XP_042208767.1 rho GDP-dissociation inhibitor 1-like [Homarus americanus]XP_042208768.1 rho GDP-dissociation inhibitor 1-like [Homarus americanus]KAG7153927.1 Rho GDP-dissociation inhibitor 1-like [Homarus americanus]
MAEDDNIEIEPVAEEEEQSTNYKPPPEKTLEEMISKDADDESLRKYKETLLGSSVAGALVLEPDNPNRVMVRKLVLLADGRPDMELDLTGDLDKLKESCFTIKEGISYKIRIDFHVQREIVTGMKYVQRTFRKGILVDKMAHMVGSYAPKEEIQSYTTPMEDAPSGLIARGHYTVKSLFTDDDGNEHLKWKWAFNIKENWN